MSRFVTTDTHRIDLGDGDFVLIRKELGYRERLGIQEKLMSNLTVVQKMQLEKLAERAKAEEQAKEQGVDNGPKEKTPIELELENVPLNHEKANIETLVRAIVAWGGPGFTVDGAVMPINADIIGKLDSTAEQILEEIKRVMVTETEGFTKPPSQRTDSKSAQADPQDSVSTT